MNAVEVDSVTFAYGEQPVIEDVSMTVEDGEFLGLVGPNGSGKSTLLELVLGLRRPDSGTVRLFGEPAHEFDDGTRVGYVAQQATRAAGELPITAREVVRMGRYPHAGIRRLGADDRRAIEDAMARVGVTDLAGRRVGSLSGGQRQRVFIARALASEADLLALDEPAVGVDADSRDAFYDLLADLNDGGMTVILIEHDLGVVTERASRVACINRRVFFHGDPEGFADSDALANAYGANQRQLHHDHP
ncbi:metal ABC transporter ATP-binding protein [Halomarina halobia]|uniref:Cobalamin import ATP-binding protein BtuD n=1 Tax=Halomarina halobia TaxID=3033386 RepID=A0ABD6A6T0_9EURY|nr:metal ABC transporter ATP-binding protein [Halomarina sp. PSR21]